MIKGGVFFLFLMFTLGVHALPLKPLPQQPVFQVDPMGETPVPSCQELPQRLLRFQQLNRDTLYGLTDFMDVSSQRIFAWHKGLLPFENSTKPIPQGTFGVLAEGAGQMGELTGLTYDVIDFLERDLEAITQGLQTCITK